MEAKKIQPQFSDLQKPEALLKHIKGLKKLGSATPHAEILEQLLNEIEPIDFEALAFPQLDVIKTELTKLEEEFLQLKAEPEKTEINKKRREALQKQIGGLKVNQKHFLVLSIENVLKVAKTKHWDLCKNLDFIYLYNGCFWNELDKETFQKFLGEASEKMGVAKFSARFYQYREQLFKQFLSTAYLPTPEQDNKTVLINLMNGTFEVSPKGKTKLRPFNSSDFITYQLPFEYRPEAEAPLFEAYLNKVLPDIDSQKVLAEYLGYVFIKNGGLLKLEKALILFGTGANGKSVFFDIVTALFGRENISNYSLQSLTEEKGFYRAKIGNKLVNYASEINGKLETSLFKAMTSGEPVEACLKYGQPFTMNDYAKMIFNCNELPKDVEQTNAYFRRFLIIPFDVTIKDNEKDPQLANKIIEQELSGVFNWVLQGLSRLLEQKRFTECTASQQAVDKYRVESDSVQMFLSENNYKVSAVNILPLQELFNEYRSYCFDCVFKACSRRTFAERLRSVGYETERKNYGTVVTIEKAVLV